MTIFDQLEPYTVPSTMIGRYIDPLGLANVSSHDLHIPALMPNIGFGSRQVVSQSLSTACLANDSACKPSVRGSIQTQNYITVPMPDNRSFRCMYFRQGAELEIDAFNGDEDQLHVTNRRDPSFNLY